MNSPAALFQLPRQWGKVLLGGLPAGNNDISAGVLLQLFYYVLVRLFPPLGKSVARVAKRAIHTAAGQTQKHRGYAGVWTLALQRIKDFIYFECILHKVIVCCAKVLFAFPHGGCVLIFPQLQRFKRQSQRFEGGGGFVKQIRGQIFRRWVFQQVI